jgi:hypothetical protein
VLLERWANVAAAYRAVAAGRRREVACGVDIGPDAEERAVRRHYVNFVD